MKRYSSFDEIDRDLKYLKLKSKIDLEEMKLSITSTKDMVADSLSPMNLLAGTVATLARRSFYGKVVDRFVKIKPLRKVIKRLF